MDALPSLIQPFSSCSAQTVSPCALLPSILAFVLGDSRTATRGACTTLHSGRRRGGRPSSSMCLKSFGVGCSPLAQGVCAGSRPDATQASLLVRRELFSYRFIHSPTVSVVQLRDGDRCVEPRHFVRISPVESAAGWLAIYGMVEAPVTAGELFPRPRTDRGAL